MFIATKRLMKEYAELQSSPNFQYSAAPLEDNIFDWHFTIRGPQDSEFENGIYHGRIVLLPQYPYKPPSIYFLTPNDRFELGKKICLSITGYHPTGNLVTSLGKTALIALISFMTTEGKSAVGALDYTPEERKILAKKCGCKNCEQVLPIPQNGEENHEDHEDHDKLADMLVVSGDKKENVESESQKDTTIQTDIIILYLYQATQKMKQRVPTSSTSANVEPVKQTATTAPASTSSSSNQPTTTPTTNSAPSTNNINRTNSQVNMNQNNINEERFKSFIDTKKKFIQ
ncbi:UBC-like protein [Piromyces finnis]|uniref:UBC-like protein n=1 Tax=Piromyces finnis TaxID=1754191 RepID=A0A1Y1V4I8_9FUNG|nr:UBC-like protein [Piromyces finnis]|eukprot:ORX47129.1 UBC-like protein [Piromyces finnis]